jgi:hypothetical protein
MTRRLSSFWHHPPSLDEVASMKRYSSMAVVLQFGFSRARAGILGNKGSTYSSE